jgi:hypothetical protein
MQTKEHLLYFFLSKPIRLHYSDRKFFNNLTMIIKDTNKITSGQDRLFTKLIEKYLLQLKQTNLTKDQILALPWKAEVIETSKEYTAARVSLLNDKLVIRVPMNNKFIKRFDDIKDNTFNWDKTKKAYISSMSTYALKIAYTILPKYFPEVHYCNQIETILAKVSHLSDSNLIWEPTLVNINNNYYIIAVNEPVGNRINNIELNTDPKTLFKLSKLGIKTHKDLIDTKIKKFASEFATEIEIDETGIVTWLTELDVKQVLLGKGVHTAFLKTKQLFVPLIKNLEKNNIEVIPVKSDFAVDSTIKTPVLLQYHGDESRKFCGPGAVAKCVFIKNSIPIEVK